MRELDKSLRSASDLRNTSSEGSPNGDSPIHTISPNTDWAMTSFESGSLTSASTVPSSHQVNNSPSEEVPASQPSGDGVSSIETDFWAGAHSLLNAQQDAYQKALGTLDSSQGQIVTRMYQLKYEWTTLFCQQSLPALALLFIMYPPSPRLGAPVTFRPFSYQSALYRL